jgi:antitoxin CptB
MVKLLSFGTGCGASLLHYKQAIMSLADPLETRRKRLLWRASRRGIKEMDIIIGGFAEANLSAMDATALDAFEAILDIPDQDLLSYATLQAEIPVRLRSPMLDAVLSFRPTVNS